MPFSNTFALQYENASESQFGASAFEMIISDGHALYLTEPGANPPPVSDAGVANLQAQGRLMIGYVDVAVTDSSRPYWDPAWTIGGNDYDDLSANAPEWLVDHPVFSFNTDEPSNPIFQARRVSFWLDSWKEIVLDQAFDLISRGYDGIFLDDVGAYFGIGEYLSFDGQTPNTLENTWALAAEMANFVADIVDAIRAVKPDAIIISNSDPFMPGSAFNDEPAARDRFLEAVDFHLMENKTIFGIDNGLDPFNGLTNLLILDSKTTDEMVGDPTPEQSHAYGQYYGTAAGNYNNLANLDPRDSINPVSIVGNGAGNNLSGTVKDDHLAGLAGNDTLAGAGGDDWIDGGLGDDNMSGGNGNDIFIVDSLLDYAEGGDGIDEVRSIQNHRLSSTTENLRLIAGNVGTGNALDNVMHAGRGVGDGQGTTLHGLDGQDTLYGGLLSDHLIGGNGHDTIFGGAGNDRLDGGAGDDELIGGNGIDLLVGGGTGDSDLLRGGSGDDTYQVQDSNDTVFELSNQGSDLIRTGLDYILPANVERLVILASARNATGNALDNIIVGTGGGDTISGLNGADTLRGGAGLDTILGGNGIDILDGGAGKDTMTGGADKDTFQFRSLSDFNTTRATADVITDFDKAAGEKIQINLIDANTNTGVDDDFEWIASNAFSGTAGELRFQQVGSSTFVEGDVNGDGSADLVIKLNGLIALTSNSFIGVRDLQPNREPVELPVAEDLLAIFRDYWPQASEDGYIF